MTSIDLYINFAIHAVLGRLGEADAMMRMAGDSIRKVADELRRRHPIDERPLYRGVLLDADDALVKDDPRYTFVSWSESEDVARWFACTRSAVSEPLAEHNAKLRGYLLMLSAPTARVLFHHSWASAFANVSLEAFALLHPMMGVEGCRQIGWSLRTQQEVVMEPVAGFSIKPVDVEDVELTMLEQKLAPPWIGATHA